MLPILLVADRISMGLDLSREPAELPWERSDLAQPGAGMKRRLEGTLRGLACLGQGLSPRVQAEGARPGQVVDDERHQILPSRRLGRGAPPGRLGLQVVVQGTFKAVLEHSSPGTRAVMKGGATCRPIAALAASR